MIIHVKRFLTAFFVKAVLRPLRWLGSLGLILFVIPLYRLYSLISRRIFTIPKTNRRLTALLTSRYALHILFVITVLSLTAYNLFRHNNPAAAGEQVNTILLAQLVVDEGIGDITTTIEDYPNPEAVRWRQLVQNPRALISVPFSPLTKETLETPETTGLVSAPRSTVETYVVQSGDTISGIARRFNISVNTILWENNLSATSIVRPGDKLTILPSSGVSHNVTAGQTLGQIASLYGVNVDAIMAANSLANPNQVRIGSKLIIPGGNKIIQQTPSRSVAGQIGQAANAGLQSLTRIIPGPSVAVPAGGAMVWPTVGHRITQYYSWRHSGVDIANHVGTAIYAADDGTVTTVGYNRGGYGNQIIINHGNGKQTRYAHLSAFSVNVGQKVTKGQYIAAMGSTGRSTGPHLHFEVIVNGRIQNPLNYVR